MNQSVVILFRHIFNKCVKFAPTIHEEFNTSSYQEEVWKKAADAVLTMLTLDKMSVG